MRFSLIILAFYIGLLSCFPCQDAPVRMAGQISTQAGHDDAGHEDEPGDYCSPFCICACCATVNMPPKISGFTVPSPMPAPSRESFLYKASSAQTNAHLIWQPPRHV
ncbi:DUF6660 family protein [Dyadobacter fermentans]|uniref:Secreted protein n=1 Tax=Dyadobacter fermentans (strain ATCC 700827 / DSM 18053 / CIP 107007 / KCTC 52180 / NS114) TaxID=471854 RepID=C6VSK8_DYAFD|nr:DUF6660 family protein [Dyadobacter fermentans]ACT92830.1 conserved hypothetical protein [Dyadobacter fermentans DSM 18053]